MYSASSEFHQAVANGAHQIALLIFDDAVFTNDDLNVSVGIEFNDYFNTEEDLTIGTALSNELSFTLFNDSGLLNDYEFGNFLATIGAQISKTTVTANGTVQIDTGENTYVANSSSPYLTRNGSAVADQPGSKVVSMLLYDGTVYCGLADGTCIGYDDSDGSLKDISLNGFMLEQMQKWSGKGMWYSKTTRILKIWQRTTLRTYEFVPLGYFTAERPNVPNVIEINFTCYDYMQRFEVDMPDDTALGITWPSTFANLFEKMCAYVGVDYVTSTFINSTATISARPDDFDSATMRDVLQWLAEAAASVARFDRDGRLKMDWLRTTSLEIDENGYSQFNPYWYQTKKVTQVCNRASNGDYDNYSGSGDEAYLIQDNPLLRGVT